MPATPDSVSEDNFAIGTGSLYSIQYKSLDFQGAHAVPFQDERGQLSQRGEICPITPSRWKTDITTIGFPILVSPVYN